MTYKKKEEREKSFVEYIVAAGGVDRYGKYYEKGHWYWCFYLKNGETRYWTDLSKENQKKLGVYEENR